MSAAGLGDSMLVSGGGSGSQTDLNTLPSVRSLAQLKEVDDIKDAYDLKDRLGEGAFGTVHVGIKKDIGTKFAIKSINAAKLEKQK